MNTTPRLKWDGADRLLTNYGCGRLGLESDELIFWQSRATLTGRRAEVPALTDIRTLAASIRRNWSDMERVFNPGIAVHCVTRDELIAQGWSVEHAE